MSVKSGNTVVKYKKGGVQFEILAKQGTVAPYRENKLGIDKVLVIDEIFNNSSKFQKVKSSDLKKIFGTDDKMECIKVILADGVFSLTQKEMQEKVAARKKEIINYIQKYYHDPTKNPVIPHPVSRIESAIDQIKIKIDPDQSGDHQALAFIKKLPEVLPIKPVGVLEIERNIRDEEVGRSKGGKSGKYGGYQGGKNKNRIEIDE